MNTFICICSDPIVAFVKWYSNLVSNFSCCWRRYDWGKIFQFWSLTVKLPTKTDFWRHFTVTLAVESLKRPMCSPDEVKGWSMDPELEISWVVSICFRFTRIIFIQSFILSWFADIFHSADKEVCRGSLDELLSLLQFSIYEMQTISNTNMYKDKNKIEFQKRSFRTVVIHVLSSFTGETENLSFVFISSILYFKFWLF